MKTKRINDRFFEIIPKKQDNNELLYKKCQALSNYTQQRRILIEETREQRKKIYHLSMEITAIHEEIEKLMTKEKN